MDTIRFANGEVHSCSFCATTPDEAIIALDDVDFAQAAATFSDANKTSEMQFGDVRLVGYTQLVMLGIQPYGIQAVLRGGHNERQT